MELSKPPSRTSRSKGGKHGSSLSRLQSTHASSAVRRRMQWVSSRPTSESEPWFTSLPGKVGMSILTKGLAMDFVREGRHDMAITSIWPASSIESAATERAVASDQDIRQDLRKPTIYSDAILAMLEAPAEEVNGLIDTDEDFLRRHGVSDFSKYNVVPGSNPRRIMPANFPVLEVAEQDDEGRRTDSTKLGKPKL